MSYGSMAQATNIVKAFGFFDRLTDEAKEVCRRFEIGPMQIMSCGLNTQGRSGRVTGTDLPKIMGLIDAKYGDLRTVIAEKLGILKPDDGDSTFTRVGKFMEPFMASQAIVWATSFLEDLQMLNPQGRFYITLGEFFEHPTLNLGTSTDLALYMDEKLYLVAELKHTGADWEDEAVPDKVQAQVQAQLMCTGMNQIPVFAVTGGNRNEKMWIIKPDKKWQKEIEKAVEVVTTAQKAGRMPEAISYIKPKTAPAKSEPKLTATAKRLAAQISARSLVHKKEEAWLSKAKRVLGSRFKVNESAKGEGWSAYRVYVTNQPKLDPAKALPAIEELLAKYVPDDKLKEASDKVLEIKIACTKDGSQVAQFTFRGDKE